MAPALVEVVQRELPDMCDVKASVEKISPCCGNGATTDHDRADVSQFPNPGLQVTKEKTIKMVDVPIEKPGPGEVLLYIKATGICG